MKEFTKVESKMLKGISILFMVGLHLFNRVDLNGYYEPWIVLGKYPLIYYISFIFDACVPIYCFSSGYATYLNKNKPKNYNKKRLQDLLINFWIVVFLTCIVGFVLNHKTIPGNISNLFGTLFLYDIKYVVHGGSCKLILS